MSIRIVTLSENTVCAGRYLAEWGLSILVETEKVKVLLDTGASVSAQHNADLMGIDLRDIDKIILSHGHYDHTGGLAETLNNARPTRVFVHPEALVDKYARNENGTSRVIGIPAESRSALAHRAEIHLTTSPTEVGEGLWATGPIPRHTDFEDTGGPFFKDAACKQPDELIDDQAAFVETPDGIVVILGCAHAGIINTLWYVRELLPGRPIHTAIGGTHLVTANESRMSRTVESLREFDIQRLVPLHCTGFPAAARLWKDFPNRVSMCPVGTRLNLGA